MTATKDADRVYELDALRGIAALAVTVQHLMMPRGIRFLGWSAVDLFFVLSGYLITGIIVKNCAKPGFLKTFYIRRSLRIWPIYYLALVGLIGLGTVEFRHTPPDQDSLRGVGYYFAYLQNVQLYWGGKLPPFNHHFRHTWTLAVEEQFYMFWPAILLLVGGRRLVPLAVAAIGFSVAARGFGLHYRLLAGRLDSFGLGALLSAMLADPLVAYQRRRVLTTGFVLASAAGIAWLVGLAGIHGFAALSRPAERIDYPAVSFLALAAAYFGVIGLVALHAGHRLLAPLRARWLIYLGTISYGMYLYHYPIQHYMQRINETLGIGQAWWYDAVALGVCILIGHISWRLIEKPIDRYKRKFPYGPAVESAQRSGDHSMNLNGSSAPLHPARPLPHKQMMPQQIQPNRRQKLDRRVNLTPVPDRAADRGIDAPSVDRPEVIGDE